MKDYPTNKEEYWKLLARHWDDIYDIIYKFCPEHGAEADNLRTSQDPKIARILSDAWAAAPDESWIHNIPSWGILCNLCSESYVLDEEIND